MGSGAYWFTYYAIGKHRIGRPAYLARTPWAPSVLKFADSGALKGVGVGAAGVGIALNYLQFSAEGDSVPKAAAKTAFATAYSAGAGSVGATTGEVIGGFVGALIPGLGETGLSEAGGAALGGLVGGWAGNTLGSWLADDFFGK